MVVSDGRIEGVFDDAGRARDRVGPDTQVLRGATLTAGFVDAHIHPVGYGRFLQELDLVGAASYADTLARVAQVDPSDGWLRGRGWKRAMWSR